MSEQEKGGARRGVDARGRPMLSMGDHVFGAPALMRVVGQADSTGSGDQGKQETGGK